jgi:hypothetical protein
MPLEDVLTIESGIRGPAQLAVKLAKMVAQKENPITDCVLVYFTSDGWPGMMFTTMDPEELGELERFFRMVNDEAHSDLWRSSLELEEYDDEDDDA